MVIFFNFSPTSNHLHPLQVDNCDSNSRLVVDEDDNCKVRLERVNYIYDPLFSRLRQDVVRTSAPCDVTMVTSTYDINEKLSESHCISWRFSSDISHFFLQITRPQLNEYSLHRVVSILK